MAKMRREKASIRIVAQGLPKQRPVREQTNSISNSVWSMWQISNGRLPWLGVESVNS
ncbi:hypothetical protein [Nostoc sp. CALU 1950]|uniref:hypothetical protein n=1 Tax=Nostoc sp. CALU 1950 TaxID=3104321 RepID=UPI003EBF1F0A